MRFSFIIIAPEILAVTNIIASTRQFYYPSTYNGEEQYCACYQLCGGQVQAIIPSKHSV